MGSRTFIGRRRDAKIVVVGIVHQLSKKSFQWEAFCNSVVMDFPITDAQWHKEGYKAFRNAFGNLPNKGRVGTMAMAKARILEHCPIPKERFVPQTSQLNNMLLTGPMSAGNVTNTLLLGGDLYDRGITTYKNRGTRYGKGS